MLENDNSYEARKELKNKLKEFERVIKGIKKAKVFVSGGDKISAEEILEMQQKFNKTIEEAAKETGIKYLDCAEAVQDKNGILPEEASTDGVHLSQQYCLYWQNYIIDKT